TSVAIPAVTVSDAPRFGHRAFMMDVGRNFQPKEQVLKTLDLMGLYKLNVLHFHLNEDEGWRLEIPGLPELTEVGAKRGHTQDNKKNLQPSYGSGPDVENKIGSGHYTRADFIEILKYAKDRHIRVIPEIETPGHARAAIKSMDARYDRLMKEGKKQAAEQYLLRDLEDKSVYRSVQNWDDNVINVALPSTYAFLEKVVDETLKMYKEAGAPIDMIHFGGDEVPPGVWEKSPAVQALMKSNPEIKSTDDLWYYYFGKVNDLLKARKLNLYGWEEIGLRKTQVNGKNVYVPNPDFADENFHVDVWNNLTGNEDLAYKMANAGYKVVLTNVTNFYLDLSYQKAFEESGLNWGGYLDLDKPFYFIPLDYYKNVKVNANNEPADLTVFEGKERLTEAGRKNIIGLQAPLWSEMVTSPAQFEYMLLPKLLGLAERAWSKDPAWATEADNAKSEALYNQAWTEFVNVLSKRELPRLDHYAGGFRYRIPTAGAVVENGRIVANVQLPGMVIRYTTDGSEPTQKSKAYKEPIASKGTVKLRVFNRAGRGGRTVTVENT
ncbi:beta-N-acetylhexosaminidase, partial [Pontibacter sp. HJ8]